MFNFFDAISKGIVSFFMASLIAVSGLIALAPASTPIPTVIQTPTIQAVRIITPTPVIIPSTKKSVKKTVVTPTPISTTTPSPTYTPSPTPQVPQPTYACESESGIKYSTTPCEQQTQKRGKSVWEGSCDSGWNPSLSSDAKLSYKIEKDGSPTGRAYIQIKRPGGETAFPKQEIHGSGALPVKEFVKEDGQYSITLEQVGVDANGRGLCTKHTITLE